MSLRHAVLGLLAAEPASGYELTQRFERSLANAWSASHSQIYPELSKLEEAGYIEVVAEGARNRRTWGVTEAGREELHRWLMETEPNRTQRSELGLRAFLQFLIPAEDRRVLMERELAILEQQREAFAEMWAAKEERDRLGEQNAFAPVLDLGIRNNAMLIAWLREQLDALK